ncbi:uncharacterized protein LOC116923115 [Daphnia magna]|uniref:uncharacterized protein LOC116923115 n=1 Tax=Daphnia magna TaxID=35525 RepID=UPI001E1BD169|nr:uncharacterized protein LOC116923115 [Daphnia magna]
MMRKLRMTKKLQQLARILINHPILIQFQLSSRTHFLPGEKSSSWIGVRLQTSEFIAFAKRAGITFPHPSRQATLDRLATRMLVTGNIPLIFFRNPEWKEFVKVIIPGYKAPTDFTMRRRHIGEEYDRIKMLECPTKINIGSLYWHRLHVTYWESLLLRPTLNDASAQR